jgi:signal transduction histidine kinase
MEQLQQLPPELMDAMDADTACMPRPMAIVPLTISGTLLGFVVADSLFKKEDISHETIQTFLTLSQTAATALSRLRGDPTSSGSVGVALGPIVIRQFLRTAIESTKAASAVLWCYDSHRGWRLAEWVGVGIEHWNEFQRHLPEPGYTTYTALNKTWLSVENLDDPTPAPFIRSETRNLLHQIGVRAFQAVAVTLGMELLGVLYLNYTESRPFSSEDRDLAIALATSAALTLKNAETDTRRTQTAEQLQATLGIASLGVLVSEWEHLVGKNVHLLRDYMRDVGTVLDRLLRPPIGVDLSQNVVAVDVNEILRDLEIQEKKTWDEAGYSLEIRPASGPVSVRGNPVWLKHAFLHFVANAKKALDRRNDTSRPGHLTVTVASDATRAFVEFTDTGDGIDPEVRPRVFSEQIVDPNPTGFGIGLRTARTILLAYGGDASVGESTGNGTRMCVWLPLHQQGVSVAT